MWRRSRRIVSLAPAIPDEPTHSPLSPMRWPRAQLLALIIFLFSAGSGLALAQQNQANGREQTVLKIQQLIQEQNLPEARRQLAEAAKQYPSDEGFDNLLGVVE